MSRMDGRALTVLVVESGQVVSAIELRIAVDVQQNTFQTSYSANLLYVPSAFALTDGM